MNDAAEPMDIAALTRLLFADDHVRGIWLAVAGPGWLAGIAAAQAVAARAAEYDVAYLAWRTAEDTLYAEHDEPTYEQRQAADLDALEHATNRAHSALRSALFARSDLARPTPATPAPLREHAPGAGSPDPARPAGYVATLSDGRRVEIEVIAIARTTCLRCGSAREEREHHPCGGTLGSELPRGEHDWRGTQAGWTARVAAGLSDTTMSATRWTREDRTLAGVFQRITDVTATAVVECVPAGEPTRAELLAENARLAGLVARLRTTARAARRYRAATTEMLAAQIRLDDAVTADLDAAEARHTLASTNYVNTAIDLDEEFATLGVDGEP